MLQSYQQGIPITIKLLLKLLNANDFFIYAEKGYHIKRIFPAEKLEIMKGCETKFKYVIFPEQVAKFLK